MMNHSSFSTAIFSPKTAPKNLMHQYGRMRYNCFTKDDPNVPLNHLNQTELDHFDHDEHTSYIMVFRTESGSPGELMSAVRIRPTMTDYELEMSSYRYLTDGVYLPKDNAIYEGSRWVGKSSRTPEGMLSTAMLVSRLYHLSKQLSFSEIIGTISTKGENWLTKRSARTGRDSALYHSQRDNLDILVSRIKIDEGFLDMANKLLYQVMKEINFEQIMVAQTPIRKAA